MQSLNGTVANATEAFATIAPTVDSTTTDSARKLAFNVDILLVFVGILFMVLIKVWLEWLTNYTDRNDASRYEETEKEKGMKKLLIDDWITLYHKTFTSNPHRLVLTDEHVSNIKSGEDEDCGEPATIARDESNHDGDEFQDVESGQNSIHRNDPTTSCYRILEALTGRRSTMCIPVLDSNCVICFEEFQAGDEIVWSSFDATTDASEEEVHDDHGCQHVYHQECMVQYLANNSHRKFKKQRQQSNLDIETPCPTCRRNFCTVSDEDLDVAIQTRNLAIEETSCSSGSSGEEEEEQPSN